MPFESLILCRLGPALACTAYMGTATDDQAKRMSEETVLDDALAM